jgi:UDP-N-acetylmuramoyl-tripeptide--D-alanyl-D-alanine ligase
MFTTDLIAKTLSLGKENLRGPAYRISEVFTDSRKVKPGSLFVALKGETSDGHNFINNALRAGAKAIICKTGTHIESPPLDIWIGYVNDTLEAYRILGGQWRTFFSIPVVAVAGSYGKTTTKELLAAILLGKWNRVLKTERSQNGFAGIPATLLELRPEHSAAVVEVGIDEIGAMEKHMGLVRPNSVLLTTIGPEHLEKLIDLPTVAKEETIAFRAVADLNGTLLISLDDPWTEPHFNTQYSRGRKIGFSLNSNQSAGPQILRGSISADQTQLKIEGCQLNPFSINLPLMGRHNAINTLGAVACAVGLGLTPNEITNGINRFKPLEGRSIIQTLAGDIQVICDYYNAQPYSMLAAFELLTTASKKAARKGKTWACLADMLELGPKEEEFHRELAIPLIETGVQNILLLGPRMKALTDELRKKGHSGGLCHFSTQEELIDHLTKQVTSGDTVLIKGSRGMKMEEVWKALQKQYAVPAQKH